jgi:hypothetical protein
MSVLFIDNHKHVSFTAVRLLRDRGVDAHLLVLRSTLPHKHPSYDTYDLGYQAYTRAATWGDRGLFSTTPPSEIRKYLAKHTVLIGSGLAPAFAERGGFVLDMFIPTGADLLSMPRPKLEAPRRGAARSLFEFPQMQAEGIRRARVLGGPYRKDFELAFEQLETTGRRLHFPLPTVYAPHCTKSAIARASERSATYLDFKAIRDASDLMVFCRAEHSWSHALGTRALLQAFANVRSRNPNARMSMVFFDVGPDIAKAHAMVELMGLGASVHFFPRLARKEVLIGIAQSDLVSGSLDGLGGECEEVDEALAAGKPVFETQYEHVNPGVLSVHTIQDIEAVLESHFATPEVLREKGARGTAWYTEHVLDRSMQVLQAVARGDT